MFFLYTIASYKIYVQLKISCTLHLKGLFENVKKMKYYFEFSPATLYDHCRSSSKIDKKYTVKDTTRLVIARDHNLGVVLAFMLTQNVTMINFKYKASE